MSETRQAIDRFLASRRIAVVGVSRNEKDFTRMLFRDLKTRGYDLVPVNPNASEIEGVPCYGRVGDIQPAPEAALLFTTAEATDSAVVECAAAGVSVVWMYRAVGKGAVTESAVLFCRANGVQVVPGECVYMFLPDAPWFHKLHGFVRRITGSYPAAAASA